MNSPSTMSMPANMPMPMPMPDPGGGDAMLGPRNAPDQHAHVLLGTKQLFMSHLTMFHMEDHMYEFITQVSLPDDAMRTYLADKAQNDPNTCYFLGNDASDKLTIVDLATGTRTSFVADIWRGVPYEKTYDQWPWDAYTDKDGIPHPAVQPIVAQTTLTLERIVSFRHFDFSLPFPKYQTYVMFGGGGETHLSHFQTKEPDYDHVMSLAEVPTWLGPEQLLAGVHVNFPTLPGGQICCSNPLVDPTYQVLYEGQEGPGTQTYPVTTGPSYWFSTKVVNSTDPCSNCD